MSNDFVHDRFRRFTPIAISPDELHYNKARKKYTSMLLFTILVRYSKKTT